MQIIPAIIPKSLQDIEEKVSLVTSLVPLVQLDICDGKLTGKASWPYYQGRMSDDFEGILNETKGLPLWDEIDYEIDLFVSQGNVEKAAEDWIVAGAKRIVFHVESGDIVKKIITDLRSRFPKEGRSPLTIELGISLNLDTPNEALMPFLEEIDFVQFMAIENVGFQGQSLDERVYDKMNEFHGAHPEIPISVDGGVNIENAWMLAKEGATRLVSGSAIFESDTIIETIEEFKNL